jgi:murein L,D-transpeptidase YafK
MRWFLLLLTLGCGTVHAACPPSGSRLMVDTSARELALCDEGKLAHRYRVALGSGGLDKRKQGDGRTPLGEYPLTPGRASSQFHTFLYVGYPTVAQKQAGYTGGDVGVHGPGRSFRWMGALSTTSDWTAGCVAVGSDAEIDEIAAWVRAHAARVIEIR